MVDVEFTKNLVAYEIVSRKNDLRTRERERENAERQGQCRDETGTQRGPFGFHLAV